jgi:hypothetical protein
MVAGNIPGRTQTASIAIYDAVQAGRMADAHLLALRSRRSPARSCCCSPARRGAGW